MNIVILCGRLTADPEIRETQTTTVASYTLAVDRRAKDEKADFIRCKAFGKTAEWAGKYLKKGMKINLEGKIQTGSYKDKDGRTVYTTDVIANSHEFCESKKAQEESPLSGFSPVSEDDFLPFK